MTAIIAFSRTGCGTARRVAAILQEDATARSALASPERGGGRANARPEGLSCIQEENPSVSLAGSEVPSSLPAPLSGEPHIELYAPQRIAQPPFAPIEKPFREFYGKLFQAHSALIFVGSVGIAVREIAPHVRSKATDPAVISLDELGKFVIPILSGHIGGANALAARLADALGATPVITTATDINHRFSVDTWATCHGCAISSLSAAKQVSAAVLEGYVPLCADFPLSEALPTGLTPGQSGTLGIFLGYHKCCPFDTTLRLTPKVLHLGIGCRRGTGKEQIAQAVQEALAQENLDIHAVACAASIDLKADEQGLLDYCAQQRIPVSFYSAEVLRAIPGQFSGSEFVASVTGVDCVCERAALVGAQQLIVKKYARDGVTVAVALENWEVHFG